MGSCDVLRWPSVIRKAWVQAGSRPSLCGMTAASHRFPSLLVRMKNPVICLAFGFACIEASASGAIGLSPPQYFPVPMMPKAVAIGDVTGDGRNDVVVTSDQKIVVAIQDAEGGLSKHQEYEYGKTLNGGSVKILDLDGQNGLDVVVGNDEGLRAYTALANGELSVPKLATSPFPFVLEPIDLGGGRPDVLAFAYQGGTSAGSYAFKNMGDGVLMPVAGWAGEVMGGIRIAQADFDQDGLSDVVVANFEDHTLRLFRNEGTGALTAVRQLVAGCDGWWIAGLAAGDVNGDDLPDLVVTSGGNGPSACLQVFHGKGGWEFTSPVRYDSADIPGEVVVADLNLDGRNDVALLHAGWDSLGIYAQRSDGSLAAESLHSVPYQSSTVGGLAVGDFTGDGCPDVAVAGVVGLVTLESVRCGDWLFVAPFE